MDGTVNQALESVVSQVPRILRPTTTRRTTIPHCLTGVQPSLSIRSHGFVEKHQRPDADTDTVQCQLLGRIEVKLSLGNIVWVSDVVFGVLNGDRGDDIGGL